jgi:hypothetical protein
MWISNHVLFTSLLIELGKLVFINIFCYTFLYSCCKQNSRSLITPKTFHVGGFSYATEIFVYPVTNTAWQKNILWIYFPGFHRFWLRCWAVLTPLLYASMTADAVVKIFVLFAKNVSLWTGKNSKVLLPLKEKVSHLCLCNYQGDIIQIHTRKWTRQSKFQHYAHVETHPRFFSWAKTAQKHTTL